MTKNPSNSESAVEDKQRQIRKHMVGARVRRENFRRRIPRPNLQAWIVIICTIVGLTVLLGDIPAEDKSGAPDNVEETLEFWRNIPQIKFFLEGTTGSFAPQSSSLRVRMSLPLLPRRHAKIHGSVAFSAYVDKADTYKLYVIVPEPATVELERASIGDGSSDDASFQTSRLVSRREAEQRDLINDSDQAAKLIEVEFDAARCERIGAVVNFSSSNPNFSRPHGWARQELNMFWKPLTPILKTIAEAQSQVTSQCRKISKSSLASHGSIILDPADGQKLNPIFPQLGHGYYTPEYNVDRFTRIVATIENTRWRFWADFGTQLLLLSIGALLGGTTFRVGGATEH